MPRSRTPSRSPTRPAPQAQPTYRPLTFKKEDDSAGLLVLGIAAGAGALALWLAGRNGDDGDGNGTAPPVVNVGPDQTVNQDAQGNASVVINYTVTGANPVTLAWTGSPGATITPVVAGQVIARFTAAGVYSIRLTATDQVTGKVGFDEVVVTVETIEQQPILIPGVLKVDGLVNYVLTRAQGQTISFVWPVTNSGSANGSAFIQLTEGGSPVGTGEPFPISPGQTINLNFNPVVNLAAGAHNLLASVVEGLPPSGTVIGSPQAITLTVVTVPVLSAVGEPTINGIVGATLIRLGPNITFPISWKVRNDGGASGQVRLKVVASGSLFCALSSTGPLVTILGNSTVTLLLTSDSRAASCTDELTMIDNAGNLLASWQFIVITE